MLQITDFLARHWRSAVEIGVLAVVIYHAYIYFRGTRGAKVFTGLGVIFFALVLLSNLLQLEVLNWIISEFSVFLAVALIIIFQPEVRRVLAELGSHHFLNLGNSNKAAIEALSDAVFELSHRKFGALIAIEREIDLKVFAESGVMLDAEFSTELATTIFHPKTTLHDGGVIVRNERIFAAACIFPVSQHENLDRSMGLRHRAAIGLTEESDAIALVVSEETGLVSISFNGVIERDFEKAEFQKRLQQLFLLEKYEETDSEQLEGEDSVAAGGDSRLAARKK